MGAHDNTNNQALIDAALAAAKPAEFDDLDQIHSVIVPEGAEHVLVDLERYLPAPRRPRGLVHLHEAPSLVAYTRKHIEGDYTALYADLDACTITAVLNGHARVDDGNGWGDHRATLQLRKTKEWELWAGKDTRWMSQAAFAEHVEEGQPEIIDPPAAEMLELAQHFQATTKVDFKSQTVLHTGQRQIAYEETIDSKAGARGNLVVPQAFRLGIRPFEGMDHGYPVEARLQYRINSGELAVRYLLNRAHDVLRAAFTDILLNVEQELGMFAYRGAAPAPLS